MKKTIRIAALALAACGLMAACNNNAPTELVDTVVPIDTAVIEEIIDSMPVVDTPVVEQPVVKKAATKKATTKKEATKTNITTAASINNPKKSVNEVTGELKKGEGSTVSTGTGKKTLTPSGKPSAADAFKKN